MVSRLFAGLLAVACCAVGAERMYLLGPEDQIIVRAVDVEEFHLEPIRIDARGNVNLPLVGRIRAGGRTIEQLETEITTRLKSICTSRE